VRATDERQWFERTRIVWALLSAAPETPLRDVAKQTGLPLQVVQLAVHRLVTAGYLTRGAGKGRARGVALPLITDFRIVRRD
jgi:hypothetical protein